METIQLYFRYSLVVYSASAWRADELWCEQAQNEVKFDFQDNH